MNNSMNTTVIIVGGGLSGLCAAWRLSKNNIPYVVLEGRGRLGGRILSEPVAETANVSDNTFSGAIDLGPSWFWPGQSNLQSLIAALGLEGSVYEQFSDGLSVIEYGNNQIEHRSGGASMAGSLRIDGGIHRLISALHSQLASDSIKTDSKVVQIKQSTGGVSLQVVQSAKSVDFEAEHVVLGVPPRVVGHSISFVPELPSQQQQILKTIPTWMAAHAKIVAVYDTPFWREQNLSGDAMSQIGPCVEIHDASPRDGNRYALFGFIGIAAADRAGNESQVKRLTIKQFTRLFGDAASQPLSVHYKDWAADSLTATPLDQTPPASGRAMLPESEWDNRIVWAGTESAGMSGHSNGYLEGAVEAGYRAADRVIRLLSPVAD